MNEERGRIVLDALLRLLRSAVEEALRLQNAEAFLSWMQSDIPEVFPELFSGLEDRVARAVARELGRQVWNAMPSPDGGVQPRSLARPLDQDPCPCGSGRSYRDCCAAAPVLPGLTPELLRSLMAEYPREEYPRE